MRNPHAGLPFTSSDEEIARALEDVSVPTLLLSCVHMSRDASILDGPLRPQGLFLNEVQGYMSMEDKAAARALALEIITDYRDRGCPEPAPLDAALVHRMMSWIVCEQVPDEYVPMLLEEMASAPVGEPSEPVDLPVVVIGLGMSGLLAAIRLQEAGIPYTVVEKNDGVGGTWFENTYPGARVDVGNHFYCYSFEPSDHWSEFFAQQPELQAYFQAVMDKHGVAQHVRFGTEVLGSVWDEGSATWEVRTTTGSLTARAVISAVGQLNQPHVPAFEGAFAGPAFHTARWDHDVDLTGKDVVMIGAGATGFQVAPTIADQVRSLTIFQRTPQWMFPNPSYHDLVGPGVQWALRHLPFYGRWYRFLIFWPACDGGFVTARVDPDWEDQEHSVSEINDLTRVMFTDWIVSQVEDPSLQAKVVPTYPPTGKRTLQDNGSWLKTLTLPHVNLVTSGVARLESGAVVDNDEIAYPADVLVYATGFRANDLLLPMDIRGRDGRDLREQWGDRPKAYLGMTVPGFPNFFMLYGPGTNLASGGSLIFHSECEVRYIVQCLQQLAVGHRTMAPRADVHEDYYERTQAEMRGLVWASPHIEHSFYKNARGEVHGLSPWRLVDFWSWTRTPDPNDFVWT